MLFRQHQILHRCYLNLMEFSFSVIYTLATIVVICSIYICIRLPLAVPLLFFIVLFLTTCFSCYILQSILKKCSTYTATSVTFMRNMFGVVGTRTSYNRKWLLSCQPLCIYEFGSVPITRATSITLLNDVIIDYVINLLLL